MRRGSITQRWRMEYVGWHTYTHMYIHIDVVRRMYIYISMHMPLGGADAGADGLAKIQ